MSDFGNRKATFPVILALAASFGLCLASAPAQQLKTPPPPILQDPTRTKPALPPTATTARPAVADDTIVLQTSKPMTYANGQQWQKFSEFITLKPGQETLPLYITFTNGNDSAPAFSGLQITLSGRQLATAKDFAAKTNYQMDISGTLTGGDNQIIVNGFGPRGATLNWKLFTKKMQLTAVDPSTTPVGQKISLQGKNFAKTGNQVVFGKSTSPATYDQFKKTLTTTVPDDVTSGKVDIYVTNGGLKSNSITLTVKSPPTVSGVDFVSSAPGQTVTVSGKGFSPKASENSVTFAGTPATITNATQTSISVIIPEIAYPQWNVPIKVKTNGVEGKGSATINLQQRVIPNDGVPEQ